MAEKDIALKRWLKNKERFADFFNGVVFDGEQVIKPEELELDNCEYNIIAEDKDGKKRTVQRYRDIVMCWQGRYDLAILAIENQTNVSYAMPARAMMYDALSYDEQMRKIHEEKKIARGIKGDYISTFGREDRLYPVISIVFYYGEKPWEDNKDLFDMFHIRADERFRETLGKYVTNYKVNIVNGSDAAYHKKFNTDLQMVLGMLQYRKQKRELVKYMDDHRDFFENVDRETIDAINYMMGFEEVQEFVKDSEEGECINMCQAFKELMEDARNEGLAEGLAEGMAEGITKGITQKQKVTIKNMLVRGFSIEDICAIAECSVEEVEKLRLECQ